MYANISLVATIVIFDFFFSFLIEWLTVWWTVEDDWRMTGGWWKMTGGWLADTGGCKCENLLPQMVMAAVRQHPLCPIQDRIYV
jgi:hypothetical protein